MADGFTNERRSRGLGAARNGQKHPRCKGFRVVQMGVSGRGVVEAYGIVQFGRFGGQFEIPPQRARNAGGRYDMI
jgi:hypothetical protein